MTLTVGSTFTGVGGADLGLEWAGFRVAWQCELDPWKQSILRAHWPDVPLHDDITTLRDPEPVDLLIGGFPCQDLSVAGKRKGFSGERSVLAFDFLRVAESVRPRWLLLENVPGLLSSSRGRDFARLVDEVVALGYGVGWRVLDARYFNVPQRRRRVFLVAHRADLANDPRAASERALRALRESGSGDSTPGWPPRTETAAGVGIRIESGSGGDISPTVTAKWRKGSGGPAGNECQNLVAFYYSGGGNDAPSTDGVSPTVKKGSGLDIGSPPAISYRKSKRAQTSQDDESWVEADETNTLNRFDTGDTRATQLIANALDRQAGGPDDNSAQAGHLIPFNAEFSNQAQPGGDQMHTLDKNPNAAIASEMSVRRLTPVECERLMGWPDNWTAPDGVKAPDGKRYAACGDGIVSWVAYWIGQRIQMIEEEIR